jgi:hypothetical protein
MLALPLIRLGVFLLLLSCLYHPHIGKGVVLSSESQDGHRHRVMWLQAGCSCVLERMRGTGAVVQLMRPFSVSGADC